ncbi:CBN-TAG-38 protein [Caenorhabditis brenneri]|uniref:sphinganine-1-phosphate aldolase n=1 Tax=Caenorhabditis brenneri TaxID=135651 RepID=G0NTY6_CAEBE|nr:CBN-TAG-38 protein [Caenorhabditis brenneri]
MENLYQISDYTVHCLQQYNPIALVATTVLVTYVCTSLRHMYLDDMGIRKRISTWFFTTVKRVPFIRKMIDKQLNEVKSELEKSLAIPDHSTEYFKTIPTRSVGREEVLRLAAIYDGLEGPAYLEGRVSGAVFNREDDEEERHMYEEIFGRFAWSNPLWPKLFPGVRIMEAEVVRMCCNMMNGDEKTCGTMSTGGSISILLACLAHRNRLLKRGQMYTEMVVPSSVHAAFFKAAETFKIKVRKIPVDPVTFKVDISKMKAAINSRTCMLVGSAPNFPFGTVDDIDAIGQLGLEYDIPVHVDACLGGFLLPFLEEDNIRYDFRVPGVSSISADSHKYGLAPKGSSVVLYRNKELLHNQYFCDADWQGGIYASATMEGSRAGHNIALCWAAMLYHAQDGYKKNSKKIVDTTRKIRDGLSKIKGIKLQGPSDICIVSWTTTDGVELYRFHNYMKERHWQLNGLQFPAGVHIMVTMNHTHSGLAESFIADCKAAVEFVTQTTPSESDKTSEAAIYGLAQSIPDRSLVHEFAHSYLDAVYKLPE